MPTTSLSEIPLIDLGPYFARDPAAKRRVAGEISRACERIGFFLISGHGVDPALCESVRRESKAFFALPLEEKLTIRQRRDDKASRGYEPVGTEKLSATIGCESRITEVGGGDGARLTTAGPGGGSSSLRRPAEPSPASRQTARPRPRPRPQRCAPAPRQAPRRAP